MNSSTFCCLFLGLILISQSPLSANARGLLGGGLVDEFCNSKYVDKITTCHNILGSNPEAMKAKNYQELTKAVLTMAIAKAVAGQTFLKGLAATTNSSALTACANFHYNGVVGSLQSALGEIEEDTLTASYDAAVSNDGPTLCATGLAAENFVNPQVTALNGDIGSLCALAMFVTNKL